jgi:predicted glycoside hydrolase/deacetylase ChbG (UPF0249 family)
MVPQPFAGIAQAGVPARRPISRASKAVAIAGSPLIVHADDFGETPEITQGILRGIEAGVVTSTSIMANMPGTADALRRAPGLAPWASFGVHLNLCEGQALTSGPTLVDAEGRLHGKRALFLRSVTGRLSLAELEAEIFAQIARVRDAGVRISHVDGHKHLHQLPIVSTAVANVLPGFAIQRVRITRLGRVTRVRNIQTLVRECLAVKASRKFHLAALRSPVRTLDLGPFMPMGARLAMAPGALVDRQGPVELCCHPGTEAADRDKAGSHRRFAELQFLLSSRFVELLSVNRARLVSYWDV